MSTITENFPKLVGIGGGLVGLIVLMTMAFVLLKRSQGGADDDETRRRSALRQLPAFLIVFGVVGLLAGL